MTVTYFFFGGGGAETYSHITITNIWIGQDMTTLPKFLLMILSMHIFSKKKTQEGGSNNAKLHDICRNGKE